MFLFCTQTFPTTILQIPLRSLLQMRKGKSSVQVSGSLGFCHRPAHFPAVCISWLRLLSKCTMNWVAQITDINLPTALEAGGPISRCWQVWFLPRLVSLASHGCPPAEDSAGLSDLFSLCFYVMALSSHRDTGPVGLWAHPSALIQPQVPL